MPKLAARFVGGKLMAGKTKPRRIKRDSKFPLELIARIENEGDDVDEFISVESADSDLVAISERFDDGERVGIYRRVGFKTIKKTVDLNDPK